MILLDTNVLIDLHLYALDPDDDYSASILSRAELEFGVRAARTAEDTAARTRRLNELDGLFDWLPFDVECTRSYGVVASTARASGAKVRGKDALIASQAHRHGATVLTANLDDFRPFAHLVRIVAPTRR
ncbi:MAG: PIN domain-containing protein [Cellulomonas sp.]|uniref:PIN domain-containing protein n=1 Tax=Cellulomonas sp. TaxID=40001 RepID=UPI0019FAC834|nr:PIN domain-containing protein [Cellulomonas sp.]MBF0688630.1 PIN domain-containing protein [Cellulomonas sp.]